jgi:D-glycero-D-manno-heptose 1,7-bisphosphate phosphatase
MEKFVLIERDGVINVQQDTPLTSVEQLVFMPFVFEAFTTLNNYDIKAIVLTMQEGIEQGILSYENLQEIHKEMRMVISEHDGLIHDIFSCPAPGIDYAKFCYPSTNLLRLAASKYAFDLKDSFLITNRFAGLQAGWNAGCTTIFVKSGKTFNEIQQLKKSDRQPDYFVKDLMSAIGKVTSASA